MPEANTPVVDEDLSWLVEGNVRSCWMKSTTELSRSTRKVDNKSSRGSGVQFMIAVYGTGWFGMQSLVPVSCVVPNCRRIYDEARLWCLDLI